MKYYKVTLVNKNDSYEDFPGYRLLGCEGFDGGFNINLFSHDLFEHWFEFTPYFKTKELSHAGECVAMGIRTYLYNKTGIVEKFMGFNKYNGVEWNSVKTITGQMSDDLKEEYPRFSLDFKYKRLSTYKPVNMFEGLIRSYEEGSILKYATRIEKAMSYGYWLGEHLFDGREREIYDFLERLNYVLKDEMIKYYDTFEFSFGKRISGIFNSSELEPIKIKL